MYGWIMALVQAETTSMQTGFDDRNVFDVGFFFFVGFLSKLGVSEHCSKLILVG